MNKRIFITGASGTGKTTLANHMSELYDIPFISTSAKEVWPKFGFKNHQEAHSITSSDRRIGFQYQWEILKNRYEKIIKHNTFITDRSPVDNLAYILLQLGHSLCNHEMGLLMETIKMQAKLADGIIFLRWNENVVLEGKYDDGNRIRNLHYQPMVDSVINGVIKWYSCFNGIPLLILDKWDFETRIKLTDSWVKNL